MNTKNTTSTIAGSAIVAWEFASNGDNRRYLGIRLGKEDETVESLHKKHISTKDKETILVSAEEITGTPVDFQQERILTELKDRRWNWLPEDTDTFETDVEELVGS